MTSSGSGGPVRTCIGCRRRAPQDALMRVATTEGRLVLDPARSSAGRGAYLHADTTCVAVALRRRPWGRALRITAAVDDTPIRQWAEYLASCS